MAHDLAAHIKDPSRPSFLLGSSNHEAGKMKRRIDRWVSLWLFHIAIKTTQALNKTALDCEMRLLAMKYAQKIQPWRRFPADPLFRQLHDALQLENLCHIPPPLDHKDDSTTNEVEFTCASKHCLRVGYIQPPFLSFSTVHEALEFSSNILRDPHHTTIILGEGIHSLKSTINLQKQDSGLSIVGYPGRDVWLSGALEIPADTKWSYDCSVNLNVRVANLTNLLNNHPLPRLPSLFSTHKRWNRARYPNGDVETTQWGYQSPGRFNHSIPADQVLEWHRPQPGRVPDFTYVDLTHYAAAPKNDSIMPGYNVYASGRGGVCADLWGPYVDSYWCSNASAGGWSEVDRECAVTGQLQIPVGLSYNASSPLGQRLAVWKSRAHGGIIHAWHSQTWAMHMFEIASTFIHNDMVTLWFAKGGGKQGGRNWCRCDQCTYAGPWCGQHQNPSVDDSRLVSGSWLVENVLSELDDPGEYFFETKSKLLYVYPNKTAADKSGLQGLRLAVLEELITIGEGAMNISIQGIGFRDTAATYMGEWGIPSGGDWALHRGGAVFIQKASNILIENCPFERLDGNAIFLSGRTRNVTIRRNTFAWIGENAIATWGDTDGFDALAGDYPIHTVVEGNVMRELGLYQKQSSGIAQNKAALTTIRHNIIFNVPRAGINFNDMLGGGDTVYRNLLFNTCRVSGLIGVYVCLLFRTKTHLIVDYFCLLIILEGKWRSWSYQHLGQTTLPD